MRLVYGIDQSVAEWVASRIPWVGDPDSLAPFVAFGVADGDKPVGGIVWHGYRPAYGSIELTAAADTPRWLTRAIVAEVFSYPFLFLECGRVTTYTPLANGPALKLNRKLGFQLEGRVRRGFGFDDAITMGLLREEWLAGRWTPRPGERAAWLAERLAVAA